MLLNVTGIQFRGIFKLCYAADDAYPYLVFHQGERRWEGTTAERDDAGPARNAPLP